MKLNINNTICWLEPEITIVSCTADPIEKIERAGRFSTRTQDNKIGIEFLNKRWKDKHYSIFEHIHISLEFAGLSRILTHEMVRHRHMSFTQSSTRYTNIKEAECVIPPGISKKEEVYLHIDAFNKEMEIFKNLLMSGVPKERARYALPPYTECCMTVSGNYRSWYEQLTKRLERGVAPEYLRLTKLIEEKLHNYLPIDNRIEHPNIYTGIVYE